MVQFDITIHLYITHSNQLSYILYISTVRHSAPSQIPIALVAMKSSNRRNKILASRRHIAPPRIPAHCSNTIVLVLFQIPAARTATRSQAARRAWRCRCGPEIWRCPVANGVIAWVLQVRTRMNIQFRVFYSWVLRIA
jgi:hypothetical protein